MSSAATETPTNTPSPANTTTITPTDPREMARDAVRKYFEGIAEDIPDDAAPGGVSLIAEYLDIYGAILASDGLDHWPKDDEWTDEDALQARLDAAMNAAYWIGLEVGRRLGR